MPTVYVALPSLLLLVAAGLPAMEESSWSVGLDLGAAPGIRKDKATNSTTNSGAADPSNDGTTTESGRYGVDGQIGVTWQGRFSEGWGLLVAPGVFVRQVSGSVGGLPAGFTGTDTLMAFGIRVAAGPSLTIRPITIALTPFIELGGSSDTVKLSDPAGSASFKSKLGSYVGYGGALVVHWIIAPHVLLGADAGYQGFSAQAKESSQTMLGITTDNETDTFTGSGFMGHIGVAYRF